MTRQLRFSSDLDIEAFNKATLAAAHLAADDSDSSQQLAREKLQSAFNLLIEERNRYYPVSAELLDIVLTHNGTRHQSIADEIDNDQPVSILLNGSVTESIADSSSCLLYTSPSPRDATLSRMPSSA